MAWHDLPADSTILHKATGSTGTLPLPASARGTLSWTGHVR